MCNRLAIAVKPLTDSAGYYAEGAFDATLGYGLEHFVEMMVDDSKRYRADLGDATPATDGYGYGEYSDLWAELYRKYLFGLDEEGRVPGDELYTGTGGLAAEEAAALATSEVNYLLSSGGYGSYAFLYGGESDDPAGSESRSVRFEGVEDTTTITTLGEVARQLNYIVMMEGVFFFDYEAALRTQTAIAKVLNINKLQQYFRLNIPYSQFYFEEASIMRDELMLHKDGGVGAPGGTTSIQCKIYADFTEQTGPEAGNYKVNTNLPGEYPYVEYDSEPTLPTQSSTGLEWQADWIGGTAGDRIDMDYHRYKYLRPYATTAGGDNYYPQLKFKNFDLPANADSSNQLKFYNTLRNYPDSYPTGIKTLDGYRLSCFEFRDLLDDDVAYYNTDADYLHSNSTRKASIRSLSMTNTNNTVYQIKIKLIDNTSRTLRQLKSYCQSILEEYKNYVDEAREICSFNNITNTYNDFFVQALSEKYYVNKPWIKAAYIAVALSDMYFNSADLPKDEFDAATIREVLKISPGTGNLLSTMQFETTLQALINYLGVSADPATFSPGNAIVGGTGEPIYFGSEIDFVRNSPITGQYFPSKVDADGDLLDGAREVAPAIVLPDIVFFGGTSSEYDPADDDDPRTEAYAGYVGLIGDREIVGAAGAEIYKEASLASGGGYVDAVGFVGDTAFEVVTPGFTTREAADYAPIRDPNEFGLVKIAYDEIFLPLNKNDWRSLLFAVKESTTAISSPTGGTFTSGTFVDFEGGIFFPIFESSDRDIFTLTARMGLKPGHPSDSTKPRHGFYEGTQDAPDKVYTMAARLAHEILARSTVDVRIRPDSGLVATASDTGYEGRRHGYSDRPAGRRSYRSLSELLYLVDNYYLPEANRRIESEDAFVYSDIVFGRQNYEDFGFFDSMLDPSRFTSKVTDIHVQIREALLIIKNICLSEIEAPTPTGDGSMYDSRYLITKGINTVVSKENDTLYAGIGQDSYRSFFAGGAVS